MNFKSSTNKGKQNMVIDALSRKYEDVEVLVCVIYTIQPYWVVEEREELKDHQEAWTLIQNIGNYLGVSIGEKLMRRGSCKRGQGKGFVVV